MADVSDTGSTVADDAGKRSGGGFFLFIVIGVAILFAVMWGMAQKSAADAKKQLENADGRIAAADRKRADAEKQVAEAKTANDRVAAIQRDLDSAKKETADVRAERDRLMAELAQAKKDAETFQSRIVEMEGAKAKPADDGNAKAPDAPKKEN
jgi:predicted  nucleic acid-binding Zn-ribbon protein